MHPFKVMLLLLSVPTLLVARTAATEAEEARGTATAGAEPATSGSLEEIVVTAQKTATRLQDTAIAITVISPEELQRADLRSVVDLDKQVPGMAVMTGGAYPLNVTIRGVGYDGLQNNSAQPGVAFFENGVYVASPLNLTSSFLDLAQIEVLRGPQGTVNGQNADGGAINATTTRPTLGAFKADAEGSYGSYNYDRVRGAVNLPLTDTFALRVAAQHEGHSGWLDAPDQPYTKHTGSQNDWSGRVSALWKPVDQFSVDLWSEYFSGHTNGLGIRNTLDPITDPRSTSNDFPTPGETLSYINAATIAYNFDFATLKSITSYQHVSADFKGSGDLIARPYALAIYGVKDEDDLYRRQANSVTEELNLAHNGGPVDWIVGAFFLRTNEQEAIYETQQSYPVRVDVTPNLDPTPEELGALFGQGLAFESTSRSKRTSAAGYGQATYHATSALRFTGGLRYSWDKYTSQTSNFFATPVPLESKFDTVTWKGVVEYDLATGATVYGSVATGVKPGGTNLNPTALIVPTAFRHESVRAYELGSKNELLDRRLRLNLSAFYNDYRDLQTDSEDDMPFGGGITNVPKSHIYGLEAELAAILPDGFRLDWNAAAMRSQVDSHFLALDPNVAYNIDRADGGRFVGNDIADRAAAFQDLHGNQLARVPHFSTSGSVTKSTDLGAAGTLNLFLQANYRSRYEARIFNNPALDNVGSQFTMNFNAHYQPRQYPWYVELQITNLTGSNDVASRFPENFGVGGIFDAIVPPRQFIGRFGVNY